MAWSVASCIAGGEEVLWRVQTRVPAGAGVGAHLEYPELGIAQRDATSAAIKRQVILTSAPRPGNPTRPAADRPTVSDDPVLNSNRSAPGWSAAHPEARAHAARRTIVPVPQPVCDAGAAVRTRHRLCQHHRRTGRPAFRAAGS